MSLVTIADCKAYCRVQTTAEDTLFELMLAAAKASARAYLRRPITAELRTFTLPRPTLCHTGNIILPVYPVSPAFEAGSDGDDIAPPVLTDADGTEIDAADYTIEHRIGVFSAISGVTFATYPYTVVATVGLSVHPDYADFIEPVINAAILDLVADRWNRRNPAASSESEGGGVGTTYRGVGMPERVQEMLDPFRMVRAL